MNVAMPYARMLAAVCGLALVITLQACGFHLRAAVELPPVLEVTYLQAEDRYSGIVPALRVELKSAGAEITEDPAQATAVLNIVNQRSQRRVLSVGRSGKASEYELFEEVTFSLQTATGEVLMKPQRVAMTRDLVFDETELLGKVSEAESIQKQMQRSLARQIITRIEAGMSQQ